MTSEEVTSVVRNTYRAFEMLDAQKLDENFSHTDTLTAFGTDEDEFFYGWEKYKLVHEVQFKSVKRFQFTSIDLKVFVTACFNDGHSVPTTLLCRSQRPATSHHATSRAADPGRGWR